MNPTAKLRFVERVVPAPEHGENIGKKVRILQQWWALGLAEVAKNPSRAGEGEWRDVPLEQDHE